MFKIIQSKINKGFTLVETLVAIALLLSAIVGPVFAVTQGIRQTAFARDQVIAAYLAQDAVEFMLALKKQATIMQATGEVASWQMDGVFELCLYDGCAFDATKPLRESLSLIEFASCSTNCPPLNFNVSTGAYGYDTGPDWVPSRFTRTVFIRAPFDTYDEVIIETKISWKNNLIPRTFTIKTNMYNTPL